MVSRTSALRRGLPRVSGGHPWPPEDARHIPSAEDVVNEATQITQSTGNPEDTAGAPVAVEHSEPASAPRTSTFIQAPVQEPTRSGPQLRRGLPRTSGGDAWPPAVLPVAAFQRAPESETAAQLVAESVNDTGAKPQENTTRAAAAAPADAAADHAMETVDVKLRQGLPRPGSSDPWPMQGHASVQRRIAVQPAPEEVLRPIEPAPQQPAAAPRKRMGLGTEAVRCETTASPPPASLPPESAASTAPEAATPHAAKTDREPIQLGKYTLGQWGKYFILGALAVIAGSGLIVLAARGVTTLPGVPGFLERYPGEYHQETMAEPGFPAWARWTHFLNFFLMALIIRSGWQVRKQQKAPAFWTPKKGGKKISINLWLHTSLDLLWLANGVVFAVLLFASGHWRRIVPTSWEVLPNAISAMLQYLTLDWPLENGWVNYNSLQQLMYFLVVFVAAPLAAITGVRMSQWWPKNAERLNRIYPAPVARAIHFPTMLFFVLFIAVHVVLVFATGALRNLNHMFAGADVVAMTGFWWFAGGVGLTVAIVILARPLVIAPIAGVFGKVSQR
jgi:thiosulfate reductase cytochrome b subunit